MDKELLPTYLALSRDDYRRQITAILARSFPEQGRKQVPFTAVETLLCYGLFYVVDPHRYGGANMHKVPSIVQTLATFFRRSPGSLLNKMLNLDGSRQHGTREEPLLFARLSEEPALYRSLYTNILEAARDLTIDEQTLPDFLHDVLPNSQIEDLLGQDELPATVTEILVDSERELKEIDSTFALGDQLTEKLVERKIRLSQHRFARDVLKNCGRACVFCGFEPRLLPAQSGLIRASHIKPWAVSNARERVDVRNGIAACPIHDAAFDQGYLTIDQQYTIRSAEMLRRSMATDRNVALYFDQVMSKTLILPIQAYRPLAVYLQYHLEYIFKK